MKNKNIHILYLIYIIILTWFIVFKLSNVFYLKKYEIDLILIPFKYNKPAPLYKHLLDVIINIIIFIPIGVYGKQINLNNKKIISIGFILSFIYEITELIFRIGTCDITDLITNCIGTYLGIILYNRIGIRIKNNTNTILKNVELFFTVIILIMYVLIFIYLKEV